MISFFTVIFKSSAIVWELLIVSGQDRANLVNDAASGGVNLSAASVRDADHAILGVHAGNVQDRQFAALKLARDECGRRQPDAVRSPRRFAQDVKIVASEGPTVIAQPAGGEFDRAGRRKGSEIEAGEICAVFHGVARSYDKGEFELADGLSPYFSHRLELDAVAEDQFSAKLALLAAQAKLWLDLRLVKQLGRDYSAR